MNVHFKNIFLGNIEDFEIEHRCYNGVCLLTGFGCLLAAGFNTLIEMSFYATITTVSVGIVFLWLYFKSRRSADYQPVLWLYVLSGAILLASTWFYNGGINGSGPFVFMVALLAMTVVLKRRRFMVALVIFAPLISILFVLEYIYPEWIIAYTSLEQRFIDVYLAFLISSVVIYAIISLILESHNHEKERLNAANQLLEEKMDALNRTNLDLEKALDKVQTLSGLLPICAACKKVRDDKGYWNRIEFYIQKHSQAVFSHSICPDCAQKIYPDLSIEKNPT